MRLPIYRHLSSSTVIYRQHTSAYVNSMRRMTLCTHSFCYSERASPIYSSSLLHRAAYSSSLFIELLTLILLQRANIAYTHLAYYIELLTHLAYYIELHTLCSSISSARAYEHRLHT